MNPIHIFTAGTHTDTSGRAVTITSDDLNASAAAYNAALHEAPIVIGHPAHNAPAWGWAQSLRVHNGDLYAEPAQVDVAFAENFNAGRYKKISACFYEPNSPSNPVPGVWYLRHIGALGAMPPAIKGLRQAAFNETDSGVVLFNEAPTSQGVAMQSSLWRRLREWLIGREGQEVADNLIPEWQLQNMQEDEKHNAEVIDEIVAAQDAVNTDNTDSADEPPNNAFAESAASATNTAQSVNDATQTTEINRLKKLLKDKQHADAQRDITARHAQHVAFAESQLALGKLAPKHKHTVIDLLDNAAALDAKGTASFSEGSQQQSLSDALKSFLTQLPPVVSFGENVTKDRVLETSTNPLAADALRRHPTKKA
ncbi:peptidase [Sapientia aquatica]|uniref:Peptidase n=1 Tax=Sapientia aquatica TaxID=1549640 RepID=A0A4R5W1T0_9BURK|nr:peptidase [Sapientia aquatica]TDK65984.1 peptidase [Sapientia aquatica]